jgi:hypothetical protein
MGSGEGRRRRVSFASGPPVAMLLQPARRALRRGDNAAELTRPMCIAGIEHSAGQFASAPRKSAPLAERRRVQTRGGGVFAAPPIRGPRRGPPRWGGVPHARVTRTLGALFGLYERGGLPRIPDRVLVAGGLRGRAMRRSQSSVICSRTWVAANGAAPLARSGR